MCMSFKYFIFLIAFSNFFLLNSADLQTRGLITRQQRNSRYGGSSKNKPRLNFLNKKFKKEKSQEEIFEKNQVLQQLACGNGLPILVLLGCIKLAQGHLHNHQLGLVFYNGNPVNFNEFNFGLSNTTYPID